MATELVTPAALEPMSLDEAKEHLRVDQDSDDAYITGLVMAARHVIEDDTRRALLTQSWKLSIDWEWPWAQREQTSKRDYEVYQTGGRYAIRRPPRRQIILPRPPYQAITSITYNNDTDGTPTVLDPTQYQVNKQETGEWAINPVFGVDWPGVQWGPGAVNVIFKCGYGDSPGTIPEPLRQAMKLLVGQWYDNRTPLNLYVRGMIEELPFAVSALINRYRVFY